ncbi:hypothetical protein F3P66_06365 [Agrobacterium fabrum]|uniref:Uncharacterized protein n=1 Tax=Agrobacterium fabrum (strain C58 / ATCC 33970) TaxID=176299 RepID=Q8UF17_AGRFC|nr:hypothetical protein Atu1584 [Agrobacterium fabrum str. C58]QKW98461.1 hypothetical protein GSF67_06605 [Agrobacterium sp. CGMCC 11546]QRM60612.1 hypothetical protein F3P66_06365 [Agrobacterium fabrum]TRB27120.1 hypothetical protein EXN51_21250 [Agrobacterium fabrum]
MPSVKSTGLPFPSPRSQRLFVSDCSLMPAKGWEAASPVSYETQAHCRFTAIGAIFQGLDQVRRSFPQPFQRL